MNKKDRVIVGVCGFGYSGSGAVLDWMKGYQDINVIDSFEFSFLYTPDGLLDLKYHLIDNCAKYMSSDIALVRFLNYMKKKSSEVGKKGKLLFGITKEYIKSLVQVEWRGYWMFDYYSGSFFKRNIGFRLFHSRLFKIMPSLPQKHPKLPPLRKMYVSVRPDSFYEKTNNY